MNSEAASAGPQARPQVDQAVPIPLDGAELQGILTIPEGAAGMVIFAHGSGSSRHSPRNRFVAEALRRRGFGTLLLDLLTPEEEHGESAAGELRFDVEMLAGRLAQAATWARQDRYTSILPLGYFGASTGSAAAFLAAAQEPQSVTAIVSRGGRPDLAGAALERVRAPSLLIVGGADRGVLELNQQALPRVAAAEKHLEIVRGATHLFEEPGALERVAALAADWFARFLGRSEPAGESSR